MVNGDSETRVNCRRCEIENDLRSAREDGTLHAQERVELTQDLRADLENTPDHARHCPKWVVRDLLLDVYPARRGEYDPSAHDLDSLTRSCHVYFDGVGHDLGTEDITDDAALDLLGDRLSDVGIPGEVIDRVVTKKNLGRNLPRRKVTVER